MRFLLIALSICAALSVCAQSTKKVETSYIYRAAESVSIEQAKRIALERAQLEVIANTFGTNISQHNSTRVTNKNGESNIDFLNISSSDIQGEWIETIGEPQFDISYEQGMLIVQCHVRGVIREITTSPIDISAKVLRNGQEDRFESSEFKSGDELYLSFQTPVDGFLAIYLMDDCNNVFCLLPYRNQSDGVYKVKANKRYLLFCTDVAPIEERCIIDEYVMTCNNSPESNQIYVLFSPNPFVKAIDSESSETLPRELTGKDFHKWLAKVRRKDNSLVLLIKQIEITK